MFVTLTACACTAALAWWERRRAASLFRWQVSLLCLVLANSAAAIGAAWHDLPAGAAAFRFLLVNLLCLLTLDDLRTRYMQSVQLYGLIAVGAACALYDGPGWAGRFLLFGALFFVLHRLSRRTASGIGAGDAKGIAALALYFDFSALFTILFLALAAGLLYGGAQMIAGRANMKTELPFLPFLLAGTLLGSMI